MSQLISYTPCLFSFCQCETIGNYYNNDPAQVYAKIYLLILFMLIITTASVKIGIQWFIYKDYFPLKQKSPVLCIILTLSICLQIILYPTIFVYHFFTEKFQSKTTQFYFRSINSALQFSIYTIYFVRCLRIYYAHNVHPSRRNSKIFNFFKKQYLIASCIGILSVIKAIIVLLDHYTSHTYKQDYYHKEFALLIQLQIPIDSNVLTYIWNQIIFIYRYLFTGFFWHCVMCYCLWLHSSITQKYSMKNQLLLVIAVNLIKFLFLIIHFATYIDFNFKALPGQVLKNLLQEFCNSSINGFYPNTEIIQCIYFFIVLSISILKPLIDKKVCHTLLPTGKQYGFLKTMRDFLMQQQFLTIFTRFLDHLDQQTTNYHEQNEQPKTNQKLLQFWQKLILLKFNRQSNTQFCSIQQFKTLIQQLPNKSIFTSTHINNLKTQLQHFIFSTSSLTQIEKKQKQKQFIKQKINLLQKITLENLDRIYMKQFIKTQSYQFLKNMTENYKKINVNMILLQLALIADPE